MLAFNEVLDEIYFNRLKKFIHDNDILSSSQHGFRNFRSTTSAILDVTDNILRSFDKKEYTVEILQTLLKHFDNMRTYAKRT